MAMPRRFVGVITVPQKGAGGLFAWLQISSNGGDEEAGTRLASDEKHDQLKQMFSTTFNIACLMELEFSLGLEDY